MKARALGWVLSIAPLFASISCAGPPYPCWETVTCGGGGGRRVPAGLAGQTPLFR
jgi:hypothetical protein